MEGEQVDVEHMRTRALWALDETRMAKSGYAPRKRQLAEWVVELAERVRLLEQDRDAWKDAYQRIGKQVHELYEFAVSVNRTASLPNEPSDG